MKVNFLIVFVFVLFGMSLNAQKMGTAINISIESKDKDKENIFFYNKIIEDLESKGLDGFVIYNWNKGNLKPLKSNKVKPCEKTFFVTFNTNHTDQFKPKIEMTYDTSKNITKAWFNIGYGVNFSLRMVDIATGVVDDLEYIELKEKTSRINSPRKQIIIDSKYYGKKSFSSKQKKAVYKKYKKAFVNRFKELRNMYLSRVGGVVSNIKQKLDRNIFEVSIPDRNAKKIKEVIVGGGLDAKIKEGELISIYAVKELEGKKFIQYVTAVFADKIEEHKTICGKSFFQSRKKWTKRLKEFDKMYAVRNERMVKEILPVPEKEIVNISINKKAANYKKLNIEKSILKISKIRLIERELNNELDILRRVYKDERFIDYDLKKYQDRQIGVKYLLSFEDNNINITDIETGKLLSVDQKEGKRNWFFSGYTASQAMKMSLLKISGDKIELLKVLKEKKKKIKKIQVYHPLGFEGGDKLDISVVTEENIGGKIFMRKEFIAKGWVRFDEISPNVGVIKVKRKGRKALYKAVHNNKKLDFTYSIKRD